MEIDNKDNQINSIKNLEDIMVTTLNELFKILHDKDITLRLYNAVFNYDIEYITSMMFYDEIKEYLVKIAIFHDKVDFVKYIYDKHNNEISETTIFENIIQSLRYKAENTLKYILMAQKNRNLPYYLIVKFISNTKDIEILKLFRKVVIEEFIDYKDIKYYIEHGNNYNVRSNQDMINVLDKYLIDVYNRNCKNS